MLVDQVFFVVSINEFALKHAFKTVFNSSSRAVMGISVVLGIKPQVASLWVAALISGGCYWERGNIYGAEGDSFKYLSLSAYAETRHGEHKSLR